MDREPAPCRRDSVPWGDDGAILEMFRRDGYVVVRGVLSSEQVEAALEELWGSERLLGRCPATSRDDPDTWTGRSGWPQQDGGRNFLESLDPFRDTACWQLAQHPRVVHLQELLYGGPVLLRGPGRWGVMRPTAGHPEWRTEEGWLHWDQNPWREPGFARVQGFACLTAQTPASGGFLCVPGFHKRWRAWGEAHPQGTVCAGGRKMTVDNGEQAPFLVPEDDLVHRETVRILAPAGSLVLWDSRLPHQNFPNAGGEWRVVHYLSFVPATEEAVAARRAALERRLVVQKCLGLLSAGSFPEVLTQLGRQVAAAPAPDAAEARVEPQLQAAIRQLAEAGEEELAGNLDESARLMHKAGKTWPGIESWYDAVWGE